MTIPVSTVVNESITLPNLLLGILPEREQIKKKDPVFDMLITETNGTTVGLNSSLLSNYNLSSVKSTYQDYILCGFPSFCSTSALKQCLNTTLTHCNECNIAAAGLFIFACVVLGLLILIGNTLVLVYSITSSNDDHHNKIKASLAAADLLTGLQIFCVVLYNVSWTLNSTLRQSVARLSSSQDSPDAIVGGMFFMFRMTSSLYHLLYLSGQRLFSVTYPIAYKTQSNAVLMLGLAISWILAALTAAVPAWFPHTFVFRYIPTVYIFCPSPSQHRLTNADFAAGFAALFIFTVLPFLLNFALTIASAVYIRNYLIRSAKMAVQTNKHLLKKKWVAAIKTIGIMQLGFTITWIPVVVASLLINARYVPCNNVATVSIIGFFMNMTNSLVNVFVYTVRDAKFRSWLKDFLRCPRKQEDSVPFPL